MLILDRFTKSYSKILPILVILMTLVSLIIVIVRYGSIGESVIFWQEVLLYIHAMFFLFSIPWTLQVDGHVRVDIFYRQFNPTMKAWVNALGCVFFGLPIVYFTWLYGIDFAMESWKVREISSEPGGLSLVYILKSMIPFSVILLSIALTALFVKSSLIIIKK